MLRQKEIENLITPHTKQTTELIKMVVNIKFKMVTKEEMGDMFHRTLRQVQIILNIITTRGENKKNTLADIHLIGIQNNFVR